MGIKADEQEVFDFLNSDRTSYWRNMRGYNLHMRPNNLAELTRAVTSAMMNEGIFGNSITEYTVELKNDFMAAMIDQYGSFPEEIFEEYIFEGKTQVLATELWRELMRPKQAACYKEIQGF